jgi:hypothetical protein
MFVHLRRSLEAAPRCIVKYVGEDFAMGAAQRTPKRRSMSLYLYIERIIKGYSLKDILKLSKLRLKLPHNSLGRDPFNLTCQPSPKPSQDLQNHPSLFLRSSSLLKYHLHPVSLPPTKAKMINAMLVFNNAGQPRLTKFYTQLVSPFISLTFFEH